MSYDYSASTQEIEVKKKLLENYKKLHNDNPTPFMQQRIDELTEEINLGVDLGRRKLYEGR